MVHDLEQKRLSHNPNGTKFKELNSSQISEVSRDNDISSQKNYSKFVKKTGEKLIVVDWAQTPLYEQVVGMEFEFNK
jgi:hypothetical protein